MRHTKPSKKPCCMSWLTGQRTTTTVTGSIWASQKWPQVDTGTTGCEKCAASRCEPPSCPLPSRSLSCYLRVLVIMHRPFSFATNRTRQVNLWPLLARWVGALWNEVGLGAGCVRGLRRFPVQSWSRGLSSGRHGHVHACICMRCMWAAVAVCKPQL